jgi:hypothetical protein
MTPRSPDPRSERKKNLVHVRTYSAKIWIIIRTKTSGSETLMSQSTKQYELGKGMRQNELTQKDDAAIRTRIRIRY